MVPIVFLINIFDSCAAQILMLFEVIVDGDVLF